MAVLLTIQHQHSNVIPQTYNSDRKGKAVSRKTKTLQSSPTQANRHPHKKILKNLQIRQNKKEINKRSKKKLKHKGMK